MRQRRGFGTAIVATVMTVAMALLVACAPVAPTTGNSATPVPATPEAAEAGDVDAVAAPEAVLRVRDAFAESLDKQISAVTILAVEEVEWPDSCVGAAAADEMCATMITPGYRVIVELEGEQYVLHTDASGDTWRVAQ